MTPHMLAEANFPTDVRSGPGSQSPVTGSIADPSAAQGTDMDRQRAFVTALCHMKNRISLFIALPLEKLERAALTAKVREIDHAEGASTPRASVA